MANEMTMQDMSNLSVAFAKSGLFGYKSSSEAFALMAIAQANGLHPAKAAERYHIIQGRPAMKADAMLSAFQEAGGKVRWIKRSDTECKLHLEHPQGGELDVTWTIDRAKKAGLTGKNTWQQFPAQMLAARCVSEGVRALFPACLSGMYTPEEVQDFANAPAAETAAAPEYVDATVEDSPAQEKTEAVEAEVVQPDYNTDTSPLFDSPAPAQAQASAPAASPAAKAKSQAEKDANYQKACMQLRDRNPQAFDAFMRNHGIKGIMDIKTSAGRKKFIDDVTATVNAATEEEV